MSIVKPVIYDNGLQRPIAKGDTEVSGNYIPATVVTTAITVTGTQLTGRYILRNPAAPATDTIDTAANIIAAINGGVGGIPVPKGLSFLATWIVTTANALTVAATANTGVTVTRGTVNASSAKEFLVTVTNGTPAQTLVCNTTNASAVITGMSLAQTSRLSVGMVVTNAVAGCQGYTIISVQAGVGVTLSGTASSTNTAVSFNFSPTITVEGVSQGLI